MLKVLFLSAFLSIAPISLSTSQGSFLTGDFQTDVNKLANCSILDNLYSRRMELGRSLNPYELRLFRTLHPWYKENCENLGEKKR